PPPTPPLLPYPTLFRSLRPEALPFGPSQIHPEQHLRPVLGVDPAGPRVDGGHGVAAVVLAGQEVGQLNAIELGLQGRKLLRELLDRKSTRLNSSHRTTS